MVVCSRAGGLGQKQARASGTGAGTGTGDQLAELPIVVVLGAAPRSSTGGPPTAGTVGVERPVGRRPKTGGLGDVTTPRSQDERGAATSWPCQTTEGKRAGRSSVPTSTVSRSGYTSPREGSRQSIGLGAIGAGRAPSLEEATSWLGRGEEVGPSPWTWREPQRDGGSDEVQRYRGDQLAPLLEGGQVGSGLNWTDRQAQGQQWPEQSHEPDGRPWGRPVGRLALSRTEDRSTPLHQVETGGDRGGDGDGDGDGDERPVGRRRGGRFAPRLNQSPRSGTRVDDPEVGSPKSGGRAGGQVFERGQDRRERPLVLWN